MRPGTGKLLAIGCELEHVCSILMWLFGMITCRRANANNPGVFLALGLASKVTVTLVSSESYLSHKIAGTLVLSLLLSLDLAIIDGSARQGNGSVFESTGVDPKRHIERKEQIVFLGILHVVRLLGKSFKRSISLLLAVENRNSEGAVDYSYKSNDRLT